MRTLLIGRRLSKAAACLSLFTLLGLSASFSWAGELPSDPNATPETVALYKNLGQLQWHKTLFGQHNATLEGCGWKASGTDPATAPLRSGIKDVTGAYGAVNGFDFIDFPKSGDNDFSRAVRAHVKHAYDRGEAVTFSWHVDNPVSGKNFADKTPAVKQILPGGSHHAAFKAELDRIAELMKSFKGSDGKNIPILLRPFHEANGDWFWWGRQGCSNEEYKQLWKLTVDYLRKEKKVNNLLMVYSPAMPIFMNTEAHYMARYPGDEYVDVMGHEDYDNLDIAKLDLAGKIAEKHAKLFAITEIGKNANTLDRNWWSRSMDSMRNSQYGKKVVYAMAWRNDSGANSEHWLPCSGTRNSADLVNMSKKDYIMLSNQLPKLYQGPALLPEVGAAVHQ